MIDRLGIIGFKRFLDKEFQFSALTVLTGLNGAGKTTLIQSILLAKAAWSSNGSSVALNGPFSMELGTAEDVRNWRADGLICVNITSGAFVDKYAFSICADNAQYLEVCNKPHDRDAASIFLAHPRAFSYLCAERLGPRNISSTSSAPSEKLDVGVHGENCAQILNLLGDKPLEDQSRLHPLRKQEDSTLLKYEVEHWLAGITRPIEIYAEAYHSTVVSLRFRVPGGEWVRATNMGFGISYALPIVLAGLTILQGGILIVENPEAHLHPAGQSHMGIFLAWLAGKGVQVILETHSDHILNGIRRAIGQYNYLGHDKALVHYFDSQTEDGGDGNLLRFTPIGGLQSWPSGFFDQYQIDVASLGRIRRKA